MNRRLALAAATAALLFAPHAWSAPSTDVAQMPAGHYAVDKTHASITGKVLHQGFSLYTFRFARFDAGFDFDPAAPDRSALKGVDRHDLVQFGLRQGGRRISGRLPGGRQERNGDFHLDLAGPHGRQGRAERRPDVERRDQAGEAGRSVPRLRRQWRRYSRGLLGDDGDQAFRVRLDQAAADDRRPMSPSPSRSSSRRPDTGSLQRMAPARISPGLF
jgi:hypothetical protein